MHHAIYPIYVFRNMNAPRNISDLCIPEYECTTQCIRFMYSGIRLHNTIYPIYVFRNKKVDFIIVICIAVVNVAI